MKEKIWEKLSTEQFEALDDIVWNAYRDMAEVIGIDADFTEDGSGGFLSVMIDTRAEMLEAIQDLKES